MNDCNVCVYRSHSGDFNHFLRLSDAALLSLNKPSTKILICGDFNVEYLSRSNHKQKLPLLLDAYNIFVDKSRMQSYVIFPLSNALSDHEVHCITLNKFILETKVMNGKYKNRFKVRLVLSETVSYFPEQLSQESWENVFFY
jgi:hypothetical protein